MIGASRTTRRTFKAVTLLVAAALLSSALTVFTLVSQTDKAEAAGFTYGYVMSDTTLYQPTAMTTSQVNSFLKSKGANCDNSLCLKNLRVNIKARSASSGGACKAMSGSTNASIATVIVRAAKACNISPKVLLTFLQKEQSLVTWSNNTPAGIEQLEFRLGRATGYGCPDSAGGQCDSEYYGVANQIYWAARGLHAYKVASDSYAYKKGSTFSESGCGTFTIKNWATAGLYNYTPHCADKTLVWDIYKSWFGSPISSADPTGKFVSVSAPKPGTIRVSGWAQDADTDDTTKVKVYVDGKFVVGAYANKKRSGTGNGYGFLSTFDYVGYKGSHSVCVTAVNLEGGKDKSLGCKTVKVKTGNPVGKLASNTVGQAGRIQVAGWAIDPDTYKGIKVALMLDGKRVKTIPATKNRYYIPSTYAAYGKEHSFFYYLPATAGRHQICIIGLDVGKGTNRQLGCKMVTVTAAAGSSQLRATQSPIEEATPITEAPVPSEPAEPTESAAPAPTETPLPAESEQPMESEQPTESGSEVPSTESPGASIPSSDASPTDTPAVSAP